MCGIAGYSLSDASRLDRTLAAQALLAGIAERGADAVGYAWRGGAPAVEVRKQRSGASRAARAAQRPAGGDAGADPRPRLHEGPSVGRGEQPPGPARVGRRRPQRDHRQRRRALRRRGHRARERRDDRRLRDHLRPRRARPRPPAACSSASSARWRPPGWTSGGPACSSSPAASAGRSGPATRRHETFFASTRHALEVVEDTLRMTLTKREVDEGTLLALAARAHGVERAVQPRPLPRRGAAPGRPLRRRRGDSCLARLAAIARPRSSRGSADAFRPAARPRPARAAPRGRGTGTPTRPRAATRTSGRPATR